jgi:beta-N-acetylhexosaminidase
MKYVIKEYSEIKTKVDNMTVEELLRAVICPNVYGEKDYTRTTSSVFIHPRTAELANKTAELINENRENPALIVSDMEYGPGNAIIGAVSFPSMRAVAETGEEELAYQMGAIAAKEARKAGYHWTFGPCVDILGNIDNPFTTIRTAGEDADTVIKYGGAYVDGLQDNGLIATLKHFPGDGFCTDDQHITTPQNPLSREEWDASYGKVYKTLIERGAMAIMPGHISLPAYDEKDKNGLYPPATVSKNLLTGLLKEKLGFEGLIVSDAVNMGGFCGYMNIYRACCAFLEAGGDCLLFMRDTEEYITEMKKCIVDGGLSLETLKTRAYRMLCFAKDYFEKNSADCKIEFNREDAEATAKTVTEKSVKIARDRVGLLPLKLTENSKIAHVVLHPVWITDLKCTEEVTEKLSRYAKVDTYNDPGAGKLLEIAKSGEYDYIVCSVIEMGMFGTNTAKLCGPVARNMMSGWMRFITPALFISYYDPYFGTTYEASVDTIINSYGFTKYTAEAIVDKIVK